jgi:hypothetical protein
MTHSEFHARIRQTENGPTISVQIIVPEEVAKLPPKQAEEQLNVLLRQIRCSPEFAIHGLQTVASYEVPPPKETLHGHNTLVEVRLPYTLHIPNELPFEVTCPQVGPATIVLRKVWTDLSTDSNDAEIYADDQLIYYGPTKIGSPHFPQAPELGPWPRFTGTNVEIMKDTHGIFRYTQVGVFFDSAIVGIDGEDSDEQVQTALEAAKKRGTDIVNYLLDVYRYVTGAEHVERLPAITANRVYFADHNLLSEGISIGNGLGSAIVNRSGREIQRIKEMLRDGTEPPRYALLLQSSRAALSRGQDVLAVVVAFQALEILLEGKLRESYGRQGLSDGDITDKLKQYYKTKDRLTVLCREATGGRSVADDAAFWGLWLTQCNRKRNGVVHRNETLTGQEALRVLELCDQCVARLLALPFPA